MNHDHIRSTNLRFNLEKESQRRAWEYLQGMDKAIFKSYSNAIALALVDYFKPLLQDAGRILIWKHGSERNALLHRL